MPVTRFSLSLFFKHSFFYIKSSSQSTPAKFQDQQQKHTHLHTEERDICRNHNWSDPERCWAPSTPLDVSDRSCSASRRIGPKLCNSTICIKKKKLFSLATWSLSICGIDQKAWTFCWLENAYYSKWLPSPQTCSLHAVNYSGVWFQCLFTCNANNKTNTTPAFISAKCYTEKIVECIWIYVTH